MKASVAKFIARKGFGAHKQSHYRSVYFHNAGPTVDAAYKKYLGAIASATKVFRARHNVFTILVAMERLDALACESAGAQS